MFEIKQSIEGIHVFAGILSVRMRDSTSERSVLTLLSGKVFPRKYKQSTVTNTVINQTHLNRNTCPNTNDKLQGKKQNKSMAGLNKAKQFDSPLNRTKVHLNERALKHKS